MQQLMRSTRNIPGDGYTSGTLEQDAYMQSLLPGGKA